MFTNARCLFASTIATLCIAFSASADIFPLSPKATYLRAEQDAGAAPALAIPLSGRALTPGTQITITALGDFKVGNGFNDEYVSMIGVFSSSNTLLAANQLHRVSGAIDAGDDYATGPSWFGNLPTDIAEDFAIGLSPTQRSVTVTIPEGAGWLFVGTLDSYLTDNSDPDGDLAVAINEVPEPTSAMLVAAAALGLLRRRA